jgi:hypothetical protein
MWKHKVCNINFILPEGSRFSTLHKESYYSKIKKKQFTIATVKNVSADMFRCFHVFSRTGFCVPVDRLPFQTAFCDIKLPEPTHQEEVSFGKWSFSSKTCRKRRHKKNQWIWIICSFFSLSTPSWFFASFSVFFSVPIAVFRISFPAVYLWRDINFYWPNGSLMFSWMLRLMD